MSKQCRICLEENEDLDNLFSPCKCSGTQKYVHRKCLERWRQENLENDNYDRCQECRTEYQTIDVGKKCYCIKWHIRLFYRFFNRNLFGILINLILLYFFGLLGDLLCKIFNLNLSFWFVGDYIFGLLNIGNLLLSCLFFIFYNILSIINFFRNNKNNYWNANNNLNVNKIRGLFLFNLLTSFVIPYLGIFTGLFILHLNSIFFIEYFFNKYLVDRTEVVDLNKEENNTELSELLIEN